jgi:hypothetical protein
MRITTKLNILFLMLFAIGVNENANSQPCNCPPSTNPIPDAEAKKYKDNYVANYRKSLNIPKNKKHSLSVDFSRDAIIRFYENVFLPDSVANRFRGIRMHFVVYGTKIHQSQEVDRQIGIIITPVTSNCESDSKTFNLMNNSFNQSKNGYQESPWVTSCSRGNFEQYKANYLSDFPLTDRDHTKYVNYDELLIEFIYGLLKNHSEFKGIRVYFSSYNKSNMGCGQATEKQISLLIIPTLEKGGEATMKSLLELYKTDKYFQGQLKESEYLKALSMFNHGQLCPNICQ